MASVSEFRNGMTIQLDGQIFIVTEFHHMAKQTRRATMTAKLKNLKTGRVIEKTFRSNDKLDIVRTQNRVMQYLYADEISLHFMDNENFEQTAVPHDLVGDASKFLKEGEIVEIIFLDENPITLNMPITVELKVIQSPPGIKGDTVSAGTKPVEVETGALINAPMFINQGDVIKVDTRTGSYLERVNK